MASTGPLSDSLFEIVSSGRRTAVGPTMWGRPSGDPARVRFADEHAARRFLARLTTTHATVRALRATLMSHLPSAVISRLSDAEVLEQLARRIASQHFHVYRTEPERHVFRFSAKDAAAEEALGPAEQVKEELLDASMVGGALPVELEPVIGGAWEPQELDVGLQATAKPEELESGLHADAPMGPSEETESLDAAAQADTLRQASAKGVPFCEECERAKAAAAAAGGAPVEGAS